MRKLAYALLVLCVSSGAILADEPKAATVVEEQMLTLTAEADRPLLLKVLSNGGVGIELDDRFDHRMVAFVNEAGQIELTCTDDHQLADALVAEPVDTILRIRGARGRVERKVERE